MSDEGRKTAKGSIPAGRDETETERADRNMGELLQELRVALPGVQVLFAFLLTVPFSQGFSDLTHDQRDLYFGVLMSTAVATALLIAPSAHHRLLFRLKDKRHLVTISSRLSIAGLFVLALSITGAVLLIADILFDGWRVPVFTGTIALTFGTLWGVMPVMRRRAIAAGESDSN